MTGKSVIHEVVAVFDDREAVEAAIEELQTTGFDRSQISLLASRETLEQKLGHVPADVRELADDPEAPRREPFDTAEEGEVMAR